MANAEKLKRKRQGGGDGPPPGIDDIMRDMAAASAGGDSQRVLELERKLEELQSEMKSSIVRVNAKRWQFGRFEFTATKLIQPDNLTDEEFDALGIALSGMSGAINFWLGDWANLIIDADERNKRIDDDDPDATLSEDERGKIYKDLVEKFGLESVRTLQQYASVCRLIPATIRIEGVHWSNHQLVAFLPTELKGKESYFLKLAFNESLSTNKLREKIKEARAKLLPIKEKPIFDSKPVISRFRNLSKLMMLSDGAKITANKKQRYLDDISAIESVLDEMKRKLDD